MRKPALLIFSNALILVLVFVLLAQSLFLITRLATAQTARGDVKVQRAGESEWAPLGVGESVAPRDTVKTGKIGQASFVFADGTRWELHPDSQMTLQKAAFHSLEKREESVLKLENGALGLRLAKNLGPNSGFQIETPTLQLASRGGVLEVALERGQTRIECARGTVEIQAGKAKTTLQSGQCAREIGGKIHLEPLPKGAVEASLLRPRLETEIVQSGEIVLLRGQTEAGNQLFVDEKPIQVLGNGAFFQPLKTSEKWRQLEVSVRDQFGEKSSVCHRARLKNGKLELEGCGA